MKKIIGITFATLICALCLASCGATEAYDKSISDSGNGALSYSKPATETEYFPMEDNVFVEEAPMEPSKDKLVSDVPVSTRKIIYSSNYEIHTKEYDKALFSLEELCARTGAYFESKNAYGGEDGRERSSSYTIRIPVDNYKLFISSAGNIGTVVRSSENNRDITEQYYDSQARLESTLIREERVLEILKNSSKLDDVLALERELADIRYEIENLTGTLRKYDSLISYCTVTMEIRETTEAVQKPAKVLTFGERLAKGLTTGINNFVDGVEDFAVFLSYNLIGIIFWIIVIVAVVVVISSSKKKRKAKKAQKTIEAKKEEETK